MFSSTDQSQFFESILFQCLGKDIKMQSFDFVSGGCINNAVKLVSDAGVFFVKWNVHELEGMFEAESKGLSLLQTTEEIYVPPLVGYGQVQDQAYLVLDFIQSATPSTLFWQKFGQRLARLHRHSQAYYGLDFNNYIGSLPQYNEPMEDGIEFFIEKRLKIQAGLAFYHQRISRDLLDRIQQMYEKLPDLLPKEKPALLHGDLWSGNFMVNQMGEPALIDPAVHYGFREAELAFTKMFGGFDQKFYDAYHEENPLEAGFQERVEIYNLYPLLVHVNLFGSGYLSGIERVLDKYLGN